MTKWLSSALSTVEQKNESHDGFLSAFRHKKLSGRASCTKNEEKKGDNNECNQQCAGNGSSQRDKNLSDLEMLSGSEASGGRITLDVKDLTLVDQYAISLPERYKPATSSSRIAHHTSVSGSR